MSFAVESCSGFGQPVALVKCVLYMPMSSAFWFISSAKLSSVPPRYSATTMQASFPDATRIPLIRSSTRTFLPTSMNILEPPLRHAFSETSNSLSSVSSPAFKASNNKLTVIIFVSDAGDICISAFCSSTTVPVVGSYM